MHNINFLIEYYTGVEKLANPGDERQMVNEIIKVYFLIFSPVESLSKVSQRHRKNKLRSCICKHGGLLYITDLFHQTYQPFGNFIA